MSTNTPIHREEVHFSGHVQGVGFRYQVLQVAKEFAVTGMVKNRSDGRVLLIAEGESGEVNGFVEGVNERMRKFIRETERRLMAGERSYKTFTIEH